MMIMSSFVMITILMILIIYVNDDFDMNMKSKLIIPTQEEDLAPRWQ